MSHLKVGSGPSASANVVAVTNPGSGTWGGTTWGKGAIQTGDDANLGLWIAAMIVSFLCVAASFTSTGSASSKARPTTK